MVGQSAHDDRYDVADEYMEVCYKLWEGSWEDDAVLRDRERRASSPIPQKVQPIGHEGGYFKVPGIHLCEPSPQRTPVLYQAGASSRGRRFAGAHAECVFVATPSKAVLKRAVSPTSAPASPSAGRDPRKRPDLQSPHRDRRRDRRQGQGEASRIRAVYRPRRRAGARVGLDGDRFRPQYWLDEPLRHIETNAVQSSVEPFPRRPGKVWTVRELAEWIGIGGLGPLFVGGPQKVADVLQEWVEETDVDGFNLAYAVTPETFEDIVDAPCARNCRGGAPTRQPTRRARCAKSCSATDRALA